jgi:hypothetical protein
VRTAADRTYSAVASRADGKGPVLRLDGKALFLVPAGLYLAALTFFPMFQLIRMSFSHVIPELLYKPWPFVGLTEFQQAIKSPDFTQALLNTLQVYQYGVGAATAVRMMTRPRPIETIAPRILASAYAAHTPRPSVMTVVPAAIRNELTPACSKLVFQIR